MFGADYPPGVVTPVLIIVASGLFVDAVVGPNGEALLGFGKSQRVMYYNLVSVGVNVVLNLLLIPLYGLVGAALALGAGYTVMNLLKSVDLYRNHGISSVSVSAVPFAAGGVVVALPMFAFLPSAALHLELVIAGIGWLVAVAAGFGALVLTGTATERDIALVRGLAGFLTYTE
jgi:O-antigen/teichoic acid export membrane protein